MKRSFCEVLLQYYPRTSEFEDLYSTFIANGVLNTFLCYTTIMLNIVTIHTIRKTSSFPRNLKTLLLSLAVSDVGVGLLTQPFFNLLLVKWIQQDDPGSGMYKVFGNMVGLFSAPSLFGVVALSVDRFLAIHLHLRYQELVTHKRVLAVVTSIWVFSVFLSPMVLWVSPGMRSLVICITIVFGLLLTTLVYIRIYLTVRRHKNKIQALHVQQASHTDEMTNFASLVKSVVGIFYVYFVFLICYMPYFIALVVFEIKGPSIALKRFYLFSVSLAYLNSSLNPVTYCWKMRHVRHAIMDILWNMSWLGNRASQ